MGKHNFHLGLIGCALCIAAVPAMAGPSKADLEKTLSACPPGQSQGQDGLCAPSQGDQMGYDFVPQTDTTPAAQSSAQQSGANHHAVVASVEQPGALGKGSTDLHMTFAKGSSVLTQADRETADTLAQVLLEPGFAGKLAEIGGHTSSTGSETTNDSLSQKRAEAVMDYLIGKGVPRDRLKAVGYGSSEPIAGTDPAAPENQRVVLTVLGSEHP